MNWILVLAAALLAISAGLELVRVIIGPTTLNRSIAVDMFVITLVGGIGVYVAMTGSITALPTLVVLALVGSLGSVSIAKFVGKSDREDAR